MSGYVNRSSTRKSDDTMDDDTDDKDDTKRKSRNLSEKKRRDQFNLLINELSSMVSTNSRKMDKSTVLKSTIAFLKNHNDIAVRSRVHEIQEDWKPSFLSNEEFTHLFLEALDGFIIVFSSSGRILYASESVTSLLGHLPSDLLTMTIYDIVYEGDRSDLYSMLMNPSMELHNHDNKENPVSFICHCKRGGLNEKDVCYEVVQFIGHFRNDMETLLIDKPGNNHYSGYPGEGDTRLVFVGTGRLQTPQLIRELLIIDSTKSEFTSRHSLEWKFLFLDHRAPPIIGYLPFEVLGTSGYDYYHVDDLDKVVNCHEALMQKGEGTSCYYRFLTKGQQWIWLQTRFYITYHQWNSKPEFIVCTHRVVSYVNLLKQENIDYEEHLEESEKTKAPARSSPWSSKSSVSVNKRGRQVGGSDTNSMSADSPMSRHSQLTSHSTQSRSGQVGSSTTKSESKHQNHKANSERVFPSQSYSVGMPQQSGLTNLPPQQVNKVDQLERKHEELQQLIVEHQAELRRLSEQLLMARYGLLPSILNVTMPYTVAQSVSTPSPEIYVTHSPLAVPPVILDPHQVHIAGQNPEGFSMSQSQSELMFDPTISSPKSSNTGQ